MLYASIVSSCDITTGAERCEKAVLLDVGKDCLCLDLCCLLFLIRGFDGGKFGIPLSLLQCSLLSAHPFFQCSLLSIQPSFSTAFFQYSLLSTQPSFNTAFFHYSLLSVQPFFPRTRSFNAAFFQCSLLSLHPFFHYTESTAFLALQPHFHCSLQSKRPGARRSV